MWNRQDVPELLTHHSTVDFTNPDIDTIWHGHR